MEKGNNTLENQLVDKINMLENKKRKTLKDYGMMSIYQFIQNYSQKYSELYKASVPTQEQIEKATEKQRQEYSQLTILRDTLERYYNLFPLADTQIVLFYDRIMGYIHSFVVYEKIEKELSAKIGQQEAKNFMLKVGEGLLIDKDIADVRGYIEVSTNSFGIRSQVYLYAFYKWLEIISDVFAIPELELFKDTAHPYATNKIYNTKSVLTSVVCGDEEEIATKLNNINKMLETIPPFQLDDYMLNKRQLADLRADVKAFKKGLNNTIHMSLFEMYIEKLEKLKNVYRKSLKGTSK